MAPSERVCYDTKLVAMATSYEELEKNGPESQHSHKYLPFGEKIVKIGPVDHEIALLNLKKEKKKEINASKICSPSSKFALLAKIWLPSDLFKVSRNFRTRTAWQSPAYIPLGAVWSPTSRYV